MKLPPDIFKLIAKNTPLICIDLILENNGLVLLGKRLNSPAKNFYFVPGGRIYKNETFLEALKRIVLEEINLEMVDISYSLLGLYEHRYEENYFEDPSFNSQYFVIALKCEIEKINYLKNEQHEQFLWFNKNDLLASREVHNYTKSYFDSKFSSNKIF